MGSGPVLALAVDMACHGLLLFVVPASSVSSCASVRVESRWRQGGVGKKGAILVLRRST